MPPPGFLSGSAVPYLATGGQNHPRKRRPSGEHRASMDEKPQVVFLHGLARQKGSMEGLARHVELATGMKCHCIGYPSTSQSLPELARAAAASITEAVGHDAQVWAVTHSMGGIVLRHIQSLPDAGGVRWQGSCMLAPPNRGSALANQFCEFWYTRPLFSQLFGAAGVQLGRLDEAEGWPAPPGPCGIIAGTSALALSNPTSWMTSMLGLLPEESDGTVAVQETLLPKGMMAEYVSVPVAHTFIMNDPLVKDHVVEFIIRQRFADTERISSHPCQLSDDELEDEQASVNRWARIYAGGLSPLLLHIYDFIRHYCSLYTPTLLPILFPILLED